MKVLYVGGNGQISLSCVRESLAAGHDVAVFNRGQHNDGLPDGVQTIQGDFNDDAAYAPIAGMGFDVICQFRVFTPRQLQRDLDLLAGKCKQYLFISSASAYQKPPRTHVITEDVPRINPHAAYSQNKADCEALLMSQDALPYTIVRPSHTSRSKLTTAMGEGSLAAQRMLAGKPVIVPGDGTSLWTITHADDFARPFVRLLGNPRALSDHFHLTSPNAYMWDHIYHAIAAALGVAAQIVHVPTDTLIRYRPDWEGPLLGDKTWSVLFDNRKLKSVVGHFDCPMTLDKMMPAIVQEWKDEGGLNEPIDADMDALFDRIIADQSALGV